MYLKKYNKYDSGKVSLCNGNICLEARGENARLLAGAFAILLICIGIAALAKA